MATEDELLSRADKIKRTLRSTVDAVTLGPQRRFTLDYAKNKANESATNREDRRDFKNKNKRKAAIEKKLNARVNYTDPNPEPKPVTLQDAKPSVMEGRFIENGNLNYNPDTDAPVTRNTESGQYEGQETRNLNKQHVNQTTTVQPDRPDFRTPVESTRGGVGPNAGETTTLHSGPNGSTISDAELKAQNRARTVNNVVPNAGQAREIIANKNRFSPAQYREALKIAAGETAALGGEVAGAVVREGAGGFDKEFTNAPDDLFDEKPSGNGREPETIDKQRKTMRSIIDDPNLSSAQKGKAIEELTVSLRDANIAPTDDVALRGNATEAGTAEAKAAAASAAEDARLQSIADNKDYTKAQRTAAREAIAEKAGVPKAQRGVLEKTGDAIGNTLKNALPESIGGNPVPEGPPKPPKPSGKVKSTVKNVFRGGGILGILDIANMLIEPIAEKGFGEASTDIAEGIGTIIKDLPENTREYLSENSSGDIIQDLQDVGVDMVKAMADAPGALGNSLAVLMEKYINNGGLGDFKSGVLFAPGEQSSEAQLAGLKTAEYNGNNFDAVRGASSFFGENAPTFDGAPVVESQPGRVEAIQQDEQEQIDAARQGGQGGQPATGLRQNQNIVPANNDSYFINNNNTTEQFGTKHSGEAPGEKQFFRDIEKAYPQPQPQQERGLGAARNAITRGGNGRYNQDNPVANFAGEMARARSSYDQQALEQTERKNQATLSSAAGTAASTAKTAQDTARAREASEIYTQFANPDTREVGMSRAISQLTADIENGIPDSTDPVSIAANDMIAQSIMEANDTGLLKGVWNSLMPAFLGGGGKGIRAFFSGEPLMNSQNIPQSLAVDEEGDIILQSADSSVRGIDIGNELDAPLLSFLRRTLPKSVDEKTKTFADAKIRQ